MQPWPGGTVLYGGEFGLEYRALREECADESVFVTRLIGIGTIGTSYIISYFGLNSAPFSTIECQMQNGNAHGASSNSCRLNLSTNLLLHFILTISSSVVSGGNKIGIVMSM